MRHYIQSFSQSSPVLASGHTKSYGAHCGSVYQHCEPKSEYKILKKIFTYEYIFGRISQFCTIGFVQETKYSGETPTQVIIMMREHLPAYNFQTVFQLTNSYNNPD